MDENPGPHEQVYGSVSLLSLSFYSMFLFAQNKVLGTQLITDEGDKKRLRSSILRFVYNSSVCVHVIKRECLLKKRRPSKKRRKRDPSWKK